MWIQVMSLSFRVDEWRELSSCEFKVMIEKDVLWNWEENRCLIHGNVNDSIVEMIIPMTGLEVKSFIVVLTELL